MADSGLLQLQHSWAAVRNSDKSWEQAFAPGPLQAERSLI